MQRGGDDKVPMGDISGSQKGKMRGRGKGKRGHYLTAHKEGTCGKPLFLWPKENIVCPSFLCGGDPPKNKEGVGGPVEIPKKDEALCPWIKKAEHETKIGGARVMEHSSLFSTGIAVGKEIALPGETRCL